MTDFIEFGQPFTQEWRTLHAMSGDACLEVLEKMLEEDDDTTDEQLFRLGVMGTLKALAHYTAANVRAKPSTPEDLLESITQMATGQGKVLRPLPSDDEDRRVRPPGSAGE